MLKNSLGTCLLIGDVARAKRETGFDFVRVFCKGHLPEMIVVRSQRHIDQKVVKTVGVRVELAC